MEEIKKLVARQRIEYAVFWIVAIGLAIGFELDFLPDGMYAGDVRMEYFLETVGILLAISLIPLSLKLFSMALVKRIRKYPLLRAIKLYERWSEFRLLMLAVAVLVNLTVYYLTLNNIGGLCALMGLTASFFCWPGMKRVMIELDITEA